MKIYMMIGIQGSGKTTYSNKLKNELNIDILSSDILRDQRKDLKEEFIFPELYKLCRTKISNNEDFIYDATNITPKVRKRFFDNVLINNNNADVIAVYFIPNVELAQERVKIRNLDKNERYLPLEVIKEYAKNLVEPTLEEGFKEILIIE